MTPSHLLVKLAIWAVNKLLTIQVPNLKQKKIEEKKEEEGRKEEEEKNKEAKEGDDRTEKEEEKTYTMPSSTTLTPTPDSTDDDLKNKWKIIVQETSSFAPQLKHTQVEKEGAAEQQVEPLQEVREKKKEAEKTDRGKRADQRAR